MTLITYPALYVSADESSNDAQFYYLLLIRLQYGLLIAAASASLWFSSHQISLVVYIVVIISSTVCLLYMSVSKPEKEWYGCRALSESIKTSTWRYMMRAEPFEDVPHISEVNKKFVDLLQEIIKSNRHMRESISRRTSGGRQITEEMNAVRRLNFEDRKAIYIKKRVNEQRDWYLMKVEVNRSSFKLWVSICVLLQSLAIVLAAVRLQHPETINIWPTEPILVMASAVIGWIQIKKFNELASAYSLTAHEIGIIQERANHIKEEDFSEFVNEAERAFSREHTQWIARQND